jgi:hypothetical protein
MTTWTCQGPRRNKANSRPSGRRAGEYGDRLQLRLRVSPTCTGLWKVTGAEGHVTTTRYGPDGRVGKVIDLNGDNSVVNRYYGDGSLKEVEEATGDGQILRDGHTGSAIHGLPVSSRRRMIPSIGSRVTCRTAAPSL